MEYLTRKPRLPLKWTPRSEYSSHVVDDDTNTVFFIGTSYGCEQDIRTDFMASLEGGQVEPMLRSTSERKEPCASADSTHVKVVSHTSSALTSSRSLASESLCAPSLKRSMVFDSVVQPGVKRRRLTATVSDELEGHALGDEERQNQGQSAVATSTSAGTHEIDEMCSTPHHDTGVVDYDSSVDIEILEDPVFLKDFMDDSDSSSDLDLPRVNVTGRYLKGKGEGKEKETKASIVRATNPGAETRNVGVSGSVTGDIGRMTTSSVTSHRGLDMWGVTNQESSKIEGVVERCPICQTSFPPG